MNVVLWILQVLLAVVFVLHGWLFVVVPAGMAPMIEGLGLAPAFHLFIGIAEWLGAAGLLLPGLTRILPWLTPVAAAALAFVMASSVIFHLFRGELPNAIVNTVIFALAVFVAYARWKIKPLPARAAAQPAPSIGSM
ncbi:MAG: DoxX family protein [Chloroflexi bacterium]|nr:DoxX family protein [Chloroflexota bacterium]